MSSIDQQTAWAFFEELAVAAARETLPRFRSALTIENKARTTDFDPVTEADLATERVLRALIEARFPDHGIQGEEAADKPGASRFSWIIDPIDGTRSYMSGMPTWGTLIGVLDQGEPRFGMMSQPYVGERFIGGDGRAELVTATGVSPIRCRPASAINAATLFATAPDMFATGRERESFDRLSAQTRLTRFGADCYGYCLLAAGHVDLVVEASLAYHDIAPLIPIVEAAGGVVADWSGASVRTGGQVIAAASEALLSAALDLLGA